MQRMKFFAPRRRSPLLIIFLIVLIDLLGYGMMIPLLPFYAQRLGGDAFMVGLLGSLYAFMQLVSGPILGALGDRYGRRPILLASILGTALAYGMLGTANARAVLFLAIMLDGITGGNLSTAYAYIADVTAPETRARGMGLVGAAFGLGLMVGPALGGLLSVYGLRVPAFAACGLASGNVLLCWFWLPESLPLEKRARAALALAELGRAARRVGAPPSRARVARRDFFVESRVRRIADEFSVVQSSALALVALAPEAWMLYPLVALGALGSGTSIPTLTGFISQRVAAEEQGRLMGGTQVVLNLAAIVGPTGAGVAFERVGAGAPYALGAAFAGLAFVCAWYGLRVKSTRTVGPPHA